MDVTIFRSYKHFWSKIDTFMIPTPTRETPYPEKWLNFGKLSFFLNNELQKLENDDLTPWKWNMFTYRPSYKKAVRTYSEKFRDLPEAHQKELIIFKVRKFLIDQSLNGGKDAWVFSFEVRIVFWLVWSDMLKLILYIKVFEQTYFLLYIITCDMEGENFKTNDYIVGSGQEMVNSYCGSLGNFYTFWYRTL